MESKQKEIDFFLFFCELSKLQPFQDGNKRTTLLAANQAVNAFETENYLVLPFNDLDRLDFMTSLLRYYKATTTKEEVAFQRPVKILPSKRERQFGLKKTIKEEIDEKMKTYKIKHQIRSKEQDYDI